MNEEEDYMLTTIDNPFNPWHNFADWQAFDVAKGYHTTSFLARIAISSDELSEADQDQAINDAIDEIVKYNVLGLYRKITKDELLP